MTRLRVFAAIVIALSCLATARAQEQRGAIDVRRLPPDITRASALENFDYVWERIRDTHFDPTYNGVDWYGVRSELRPRAAACRHIDSLRAVLWTMLGRLDQSHFGLIPSDRYESGGDDDMLRRAFSAIPDDIGKPGPGFDVRAIDGAIVVTEVWEHGEALPAGVERGWEVVGIDGEPCDALIGRFETAVRAYQGEDWDIGDDQSLPWTLIHSRLAGARGSIVEVDFLDNDGGEISLSLVRRPCPWPLLAVAGMPALPVWVESRRLTSPDARYAVGLIAVHFFWLPDVVPEVEDALAALGDVDAVVLDVRGNLGGVSLAMQGAASYFAPESITMGMTVGRDGQMPIVVHRRRVGVDGDVVDPFDGPVALLTDGLTGSASELFAAGLRDAGRVRVFGEPTAGAALPAVISELPNGDRLMHATFDFIRTTGESLEGRPLRPDVAAPLTRAVLARDGDAALEAALAWIADTLDTGGTP